MVVENRTIRWRTAWRFHNLLMATHVHYAHNMYMLQKKMLRVAQKKLCQNFVSHKKICCSKIKICATQKRDSCWLNMFSITKKEHMLTKNSSCCKYVVLIKKFCVARKIL